MRCISRQAGVSHSGGLCKMFKCGVTTIWQNWGWQKSKSFCRSTFGQKISPSKMWHSFPHVLNSECFLVMLARDINCVAYHHLFSSSLASCERHNNWAITMTELECPFWEMQISERDSLANWCLVLIGSAFTALYGVVWSLRGAHNCGWIGA